MQSEIDRATSALWGIPCPSDYDSWFKLLCAIKSAGVPKDEARRWCESGDGFKPAEFESKWKSIDTEGGIKGGSLFGTAFSQGWKDTSTRTKGTRPSLPMSKPSPSPAKPPKQATGRNPVEVFGCGIDATPAEEYIDRKMGKPDGLKVYPTSAPILIIRGQNVAGFLMVPCYAPDGVTLLTIQFIPQEKGKEKLNLTGAQFGDGYFVVGNLESAERVFIVEGIATGWAVTKADPASAAVVCFGAGRMATVAKVLRDKYPLEGAI